MGTPCFSFGYTLKVNLGRSKIKKCYVLNYMLYYLEMMKGDLKKWTEKTCGKLTVQKQ